MVRWVVGSILHGGHIELFLVPARSKRSLMVRWVVGSILHGVDPLSYFSFQPEARCSSVVRALAHGVMGRQINPSWGRPIELYLDQYGAYKRTLAVNRKE